MMVCSPHMKQQYVRFSWNLTGTDSYLYVSAVLLITEVIKCFVKVILFFIMAPEFSEKLCRPDHQYNRVFCLVFFSLFAIYLSFLDYIIAAQMDNILHIDTVEGGIVVVASLFSLTHYYIPFDQFHISSPSEIMQDDNLKL